MASASREGVDEAGGWVWGAGSGVWEGLWTDGSLAMMAGDGEGTFLMSAVSPQPSPPVTEVEARGSDWRSDAGWWSEVVGESTCCGWDSRAPGAGGRRSWTELGKLREVAGLFSNVCKGLGAGLVSGEGVDEAGGWVWGAGSGVWEGLWTDDSQAVAAGEIGGVFLVSASSPRPSPPFTGMEERGTDWQSEDGWWSEG